jgi:hypothetical protein
MHEFAVELCAEVRQAAIRKIYRMFGEFYLFADLPEPRVLDLDYKSVPAVPVIMLGV